MTLTNLIKKLKKLSEVEITEFNDGNHYKVIIKGIINDMPTEKKIKDQEMLKLIYNKVLNIEKDVSILKQDVSNIKVRLTNVENDVCILKQEAVNQGWNI